MIMKNDSTISRSDELITMFSILFLELLLFWCWFTSVDTSPSIVVNYYRLVNLVI